MRNIRIVLMVLVFSVLSGNPYLNAASVGSPVAGFTSGDAIGGSVTNLVPGTYNLALTLESDQFVQIQASSPTSTDIASASGLAGVQVFPVVIESGAGSIFFSVFDTGQMGFVSVLGTLSGPTAVPEPSAFILLGLVGMVGFGLSRVFRKSAVA